MHHIGDLLLFLVQLIHVFHTWVCPEENMKTWSQNCGFIFGIFTHTEMDKLSQLRYFTTIITMVYTQRRCRIDCEMGLHQKQTFPFKKEIDFCALDVDETF